MAKSFLIDSGTLTTSLVSYYKLQDLQDEWGLNHLTNSGGVTFEVGKVGNAAKFDGVSNYLGRSNVLSTQTTDISMYGWVNIPTASEHGYFFCNGDGGNGYSMAIGLGDGNTNGNRLLALANGIAWMDFGSNIGTGWHLVGIQRTGTTWTGYIDNVACATTRTTNPNAPASQITFGSDRSIASWKDKIDEFGFWNKALTAQDRSDLWNGGAGNTILRPTGSALMSFMV